MVTKLLQFGVLHIPIWSGKMDYFREILFVVLCTAN